MKLHSRSPLHVALTSALFAVSLVSTPCFAPAAHAANDTRSLLAETGLTPEQLRAKLRDAGQSDASIDALLQSSGVPRRTSAAPAAPAAPAPAPEPQRAEPAPATRPAFTPNGDEPFGFEMFHWSPATFEPLSYGPVDADYPLGPGDELALTLWGDSQLALTLAVNREGFVTLPDVGQVNVAGLTLEEAKARVRGALSRVYSGLRPTGQRSTTFVSLSMGKLRTIQVFLLGQVVRPGAYSISSVSRVLNALYAAGGPSRDGSLRDVRILRGGQIVAHVDLYDVVLGGAATQMARLQNGDVVFVPSAERRVRLTGAARRTGLYELREGEQLRDLLRIAGGVLPEAELERAQIDRVTPIAQRDSLRGQGRIAVDVALGRVLADASADVALFDSDSLTVYALPDRRSNTVRIGGRGVSRPGTYEYRPGMRVSDLVALAGGTTPDAYLDRALITRTLADSTRMSLRISPKKALAGEPFDDVALQVLDDLSIRSRWDLEDRQEVSIHGMVRSPGTYELLEGMTLTDLIMKAGGLAENALATRAELARVAEWPRLADTLTVPLDRDLTKCAAAAALVLKPHDAVFLRRDPNFIEPSYATIEGEVRFPGTYALLRRDERVSELVERAGGLTDLAYARGVTFLREGGSKLAIDLPRALRDAGSAANITLVPGDIVRVPRFTPTVQIEGAVQSPVTALFQPGAGVGFYIMQASGFRQDADRRGVVVISPSGRVRKGGRPEPGSRIIVPARVQEEQKDHLKDFATLMSILASAATTVYLVGQSAK
ncbi:MAG: SLBB domain-containing protein [Candidatus Eisenbacteria bacterium]|uniref:SLBB domain-containing protein n=1 Tax=Eiseniibacteriota bacterium TaxID=2212470 RepID=A0A933SEV0_UNCEI|nr:SLBB domain-containing protein [Candidatus Eisenbacteria bacterium]